MIKSTTLLGPFYSTMLVMLVALPILVACEVQPASLISTPTPQQPSPTAQAVTSGVSDDYITASSIRDLVQRSSLIVIGQVISTGGTFNMARDPNDISRPDPNVIEIGQIYEIQVQRYLKGTGDGTVYVVQPEGFLGPHADKTAAAIATARAQDKHIRMRSAIAFLMFLQPHPKVADAGVPNNQYYVGVAEPWRFDLSDPNLVRPESPWLGASQLFPPRTSTQIVNQVLNPNSTPEPTGVPTSYP